MGRLSSKLRNVAGGRLSYWCQGCSSMHQVAVGPGGWGWNGNVERPTFTPSVLVTYDGADAGKDGAPPARCHTFITDGRVQFLSDCTHALAGQTLDLPDLPGA